MSVLQRLCIATRASRLAVWQAEHVRARLQTLYPTCVVGILRLTTRGDQILDRNLSKIGGKGLFIKELETALLEGRADLAVHSLKDLPAQLTPPFELCAVLERADPRDAFVSPHYACLADLPAKSVVGTSSLRREAQIRARYPQLNVQPLRGNLDTRLHKLDRGDYDAIVLAVAGLERLGAAQRIRQRLTPGDCLPAPGQGALGIEICQDRADLREYLAPLACAYTHACVTAERSVARVLDGSCQVPLAAYAQVQNQALALQALVATPDGRHIIRAQRVGALEQACTLGEEVARAMLADGAQRILQALKNES